MVNGVLKKVLFVLVVVVVFQNWGKIERVLNPSGVVPQQTRANARVVLYSTEWCGYCKATRRFLDQKGIVFKEFDIDKDATARQAYEALGGRGIPILDVNGTLLRDFNPDAILAALQPPATP
ncbi:glutaredoxin [Pseudomonas endophytica]|uniref:Glutaredoxin n=1 Tax=Pseudomonas endophytica TaxID=1563157 RepID=A0A0Q0SJV1_9PSED|nr:glutaredoxin family protein [Pseudomonas endophytica]KQB51703.1 glutaredoxin [Pseudomonas endophytica]